MLRRFKIPLITIFSVLFIDQFIKIYIKLHYPLGEVGKLGDWCILHFTENPGMAFGFEFGGDFGKLALSIFRILACIAGVFYIRHITKMKEHWGFILSVSLILAGAMGNILDSAFYGLIFDKGTTFNSEFNEYLPYDGIANFSGNGYAPTMYGCVVDMFYFPILNGRFPEWFPIWGGEDFQFFRPIFNFADASISGGVIIIIIFQKKFSKKTEDVSESVDSSVSQSENNSEQTLNPN
ncbi:MAG: lipoprotein signal peptidase [Bacteroidota bacterium]|nr:lipoprotein signal peptidase [Bacteroidota bacterium]MDP3143962.1 lipoprotein signal peptidase [Bacteroidota bacterium]MDP3557539.1 lipoprotein signal peptidase [Bacteroidota bacterium]